MPTISTSCTGSQTDLDDFCSALNYKPTINGSANPETKTVFFQRKMKEYASDVVKGYRVNKSSRDSWAAATTANSSFTF